MAFITDCNHITEETLARQGCVSVALATNGIKTLHITTVISDPSKVFNRFEITYVNPPERRLWTFESLEDARKKYNEL